MTADRRPTDHIVVASVINTQIIAKIDREAWRTAGQGIRVKAQKPGNEWELSIEQHDLVFSALLDAWRHHGEDEAKEDALCDYTIYSAECAGGCGRLIEYEGEDSPAPADS